jgi:hypothetical protein
VIILPEEKRSIPGGYEVIHTIRLGGGEVIVSENPDAEAQYIVCDVDSNNPLGGKEYSDAVGSAGQSPPLTQGERRGSPLVFYRCVKCRREYSSYGEAAACELAHPAPVKVKALSYTIRPYPYQVEVEMDSGERLVYNADRLGG